jgi:hypothetical protein
MGARAEQQLALNFLSALHDLWIEFPGEYVVKEVTDDLVPALGQMCIKALAADVRDTSLESTQKRIAITGEILDLGGQRRDIDLREVVNKIMHGSPSQIQIADDVYLYFTNNAHSSRHDWTEAWFSGGDALREISKLLHKHRTQGAARREAAIKQFLATLGSENFLPTSGPDL